MSGVIYARNLGNGITGEEYGTKTALDVNIVGQASGDTPATSRPAAILTTSYVATDAIATSGKTRVTFYIDFTKGSLTTAEVKFLFGDTDVIADMYSLTNVSISTTTTSSYLDVHVLDTTGKYRFTFEINDPYVAVQIKGTGTVTNSSATIKTLLG